MSHIVIIGSGHAGLSLAREIRLKDADCQLTLLSKELICAYYKPNLSKALSTGKTADQLVMKSAETLSKELKVDCISHAEVMDIDPIQQTCNYQALSDTKADKEDIIKLYYDKLVFATGASPIQLPNNIVETNKILHINNLNDYRIFREELKDKKSVAIIGAGYIGCELASDLCSQGIKISVVDRGSWPLSRAVPEALGAVIQKSMSSQKNISWFLGKTLESINDKNKKFCIKLLSGEVFNVDMVISAIGLQANINLATMAGAKTSLGIQVDAFSQTSLDHIYALGDCAEYQEKLLPFITPITLAAKKLALTLTGEPSELTLPANAVPVKINACPTVICPSSDNKGIWEVQGNGTDLEARFLNEFGELVGFALTGAKVTRKMELLKTCKGLLIPTKSVFQREVTGLPQAP